MKKKKYYVIAGGIVLIALCVSWLYLSPVNYKADQAFVDSLKKGTVREGDILDFKVDTVTYGTIFGDVAFVEDAAEIGLTLNFTGGAGEDVIEGGHYSKVIAGAEEKMGVWIVTLREGK